MQHIRATVPAFWPMLPDHPDGATPSWDAGTVMQANR
jgi:hypothetical protein